MSDEDKNNSILFEDTYEVSISAFPKKNIDKDHFNNVLWGYKKGVDFLFDLFMIFKYEMDVTVSAEDNNKRGNIYNRLFEILMSGYYSIFKKKQDLEEELENYIEKLREYKFVIFKPDFQEIEITAEEIKEKLLDLRHHKIELFETILEEYKTNKNEYNRKFKKYVELMESGSAIEVRGKDGYIKDIDDDNKDT